MQRTLATLGLVATIVLAACGGATNNAGTSPTASAAGSVAAATNAPATLTSSTRHQVRKATSPTIGASSRSRAVAGSGRRKSCSQRRSRAQAAGTGGARGWGRGCRAGPGRLEAEGR